MPWSIISLNVDLSIQALAVRLTDGADGKTWLHVGAHLVVGTTIGTLIFWLVGCLIMLATKKLTRGKDTRVAARA